MTGTPIKIRKRVLVILFFVVLLIFILKADTDQQERFKKLEDGYVAFEQGRYPDAEKYFTDYLSDHSHIYWFFLERINTVKYHKTSVEELLDYISRNGYD